MIDIDVTLDYFDALMTQVAAQQDALKFYAERGYWENRQTSEGNWEPGLAVADGGERARSALAGGS